MPLTIAVAKASELTKKRVLPVNVFGIPFAITLASTGEPCAFIRVCPHRWVIMKRVPRNHNCLACMEDGVTFAVDSGEVRNAKGYHLPHGLYPAKAEIRDDDVVLHVEASHFSFFTKAMARRLGRKVAYPFKLIRIAWRKI